MRFLGEARTRRRGGLVRRRYVGPTTIDAGGDRVLGAFEDQPIRGSFQELGGQDRQALADGDRTSETAQLWVSPAGTLRTSDQRGTFEADEILFCGSVYVVSRILRDNGLLNYQLVTLILRSEPLGSEEA